MSSSDEASEGDGCQRKQRLLDEYKEANEALAGVLVDAAAGLQRLGLEEQPLNGAADYCRLIRPFLSRPAKEVLTFEKRELADGAILARWRFDAAEGVKAEEKAAGRPLRLFSSIEPPTASNKNNNVVEAEERHREQQLWGRTYGVIELRSHLGRLETELANLSDKLKQLHRLAEDYVPSSLPHFEENLVATLEAIGRLRVQLEGERMARTPRAGSPVSVDASSPSPSASFVQPPSERDVSAKSLAEEESSSSDTEGEARSVVQRVELPATSDGKEAKTESKQSAASTPSTTTVEPVPAAERHKQQQQQLEKVKLERQKQLQRLQQQQQQQQQEEEELSLRRVQQQQKQGPQPSKGQSKPVEGRSSVKGPRAANKSKATRRRLPRKPKKRSQSKCRIC